MLLLWKHRKVQQTKTLLFLRFFNSCRMKNVLYITTKAMIFSSNFNRLFTELPFFHPDTLEVAQVPLETKTKPLERAGKNHNSGCPCALHWIPTLVLVWEKKCSWLCWRPLLPAHISTRSGWASLRFCLHWSIFSVGAGFWSTQNTQTQYSNY